MIVLLRALVRVLDVVATSLLLDALTLSPLAPQSMVFYVRVAAD